MTYDTYRMIFYGGAAFAVLFFVVAVILFFSLQIPSVVGYLTGRSAQKGIARIKERKSMGGEGDFQTDEKKSSDKKPKPDVSKLNSRFGGTTKLDTVSLSETISSKTSSPTVVLAENNTDEQLNYNPSSERGSRASGTVDLSNPKSEEDEVYETDDVFEIEFEIMLIHSDEAIQ